MRSFYSDASGVLLCFPASRSRSGVYKHTNLTVSSSRLSQAHSYLYISARFLLSSMPLQIHEEEEEKEEEEDKDENEEEEEEVHRSRGVAGNRKVVGLHTSFGSLHYSTCLYHQEECADEK